MSHLVTAQFVCDTTPYALHSFDLEGDNREFLNNIDPNYYLHISRMNEAALETEDRQYAAVQLRTTYGQAIETLFALLGAVAQAHWCPVGWVTCYHTSELHNLVKKIQKGQPIYTLLESTPVTWDVLAREVLRAHVNDEAHRQEIHKKFAGFWRTLAGEWTNTHFSQEDNSVKHGLRAKMQGYAFALGIPEEPGVDDPKERMVTLTSSEFGLQFFTTEKLMDKRNLKLMRVGRNWHPQKFVISLNLIAMSIRNVLAFLKLMNGVSATELQMETPDDLSQFDSLLQYGPYSNSLVRTDYMDPEENPQVTSAEIQALYNREE